MIRQKSMLTKRSMMSCLLAVAFAPSTIVAGVSEEGPNPNELTVEFADPSRESIVMLRSELLAMDTVREEQIYVPYVDDEVPGLAIPVSAIIDHLKLPDNTSALANSYDGYFSVFQPEFIEKYDPYLLLSLDGQESDKLQIGKSPNLGPFYITFAAKVEKGSEELLDPANKRPYGVNWIKFGSYDELLAPLYSGSLAEIDATTEYGREIYINNCMSCHAYESTNLGGTFSNRTTTILGIHAGYNMKYFESMVKNPGEMIPGVLMSAHPHYTEKEIEAVAQFILAANQNAK